jgi:hypothetical protein
VLTYHPGSHTTFDTPYLDYSWLSSAWHSVMDETGLAHTHSHCFYGDEFTEGWLEAFLGSPLQSLYYRLNPFVNVEALDTTKVNEGINYQFVNTEDLDFLQQPSCGVTQEIGQIECDCAM